MVDKDLSRSDANGALELIHSSLQCRDETEFKALLSQMKQLLHFDHALCLQGDCNDIPAKGLGAFTMISRFPTGWEARYGERNYFLQDGVAQAGFSEGGLCLWADAQKRYHPDTGRVVAEEAASFGLAEGWIYGLQCRRSTERAIISISGKKMEHTTRSEKILWYVLPHMAQAVKRVVQHGKSDYPQLTPRETEILSWIAAGKSAWEVSVILGISRRTVEFHVGNILKKLDAVNAQQAVAVALERGAISI